MSIPFQIVDNYLPKEQFEVVRNIVSQEEFYWQFIRSVASNTANVDDFYFTHVLYDNEPLSQYYNDIYNIFKDRLDIKALKRIKANLYTRTETLINHAIHRDYDYSHKGAIYYINSNDGFTVLEDGTKVESKENRILLFDPCSIHNSTTCTDKQARLNINFNYF
jgi:hypothetical protein